MEVKYPDIKDRDADATAACCSGKSPWQNHVVISDEKLFF